MTTTALRKVSTIAPGTQVRVYWNLHRKCYSVQTRTTSGWRVTAHCDRLLLANVRLLVNESGRNRVLAEGKKNVHAFLIGTWAPIEWYTTHLVTRVHYNPYQFSFFVQRADNGAHVYKSNDRQFRVNPLYTTNYLHCGTNGSMYVATVEPQ